jgi:hypothetical protein
MGKKEKQSFISELFQDPRYIPGARPLKRDLPHMSVMVSKPYPESNPNAPIQKGVSFLSTGEYTIDERNNIYFKDPYTGEDVYLNKIDTASYIHKMYAEHILNDLSRSTNTVGVPGTDRDTTVYAKGWVELYGDKPTVVAHTTGDSRIQFNYRREGGLHSNLYEILNTFRHEYMHLRDRVMAKARNKEYTGIGDLDHAETIYKVQMTYEEFRKAPIDFQKGIIDSYTKFVIRECNIKRGMRAVDIQRRYFDAFNNGIGKELNATITYRKETYHYATLTLNGRMYYIDLDKLVTDEGLVQR